MQLECREENTESANDAEENKVMNARALKRGGGMGYCIEKNGWHHGHDEGCLSPCGVMMFFPRHRNSFDAGVHKTDGRQLTWRGLLKGPMNEGECYRDKTRDGSWRKRLRYAAISEATVSKSFTLSRRKSLMISFRPARYVSFSSSV